MRSTILAAAVLLGTGAAALAQCPTVHFWYGSDRCTAVPGPGGGAYVLGFDSSRRRYFSTDIDPRGNMYGLDSEGNYWRYDSRTGTYHVEDVWHDWRGW